MPDSYAYEDRTIELIDVLAALKEPDSNPIQQVESLDAIYYEGAATDKDGNLIPYRHSYSALSAQIYTWCRANNTYDAEVFTVLIDKIWQIIEYVGNDHRLVKPLFKLQDHISLESVRIAQLETVFVQLKETEQEREQLNDLLERVAEVQQSLGEYNAKEKEVRQDIQQKRKELDKLEDDIADVHTQSISVLSIFAGMAFIFTGGFTMLSGVFAALQNIDKHKALLLVSVLVFICTVVIDAIWILIRSARKYMKGGDKLPNGFYVFTVLMCIIAICFFLLYLFDPFGFSKTGITI